MLPISDKKIIAIVGLPGTGKSEACNFFKIKKFPVVRFGEITDTGLKLANLSQTEKNERFFREKIRKDLGFAAFAIKSENKITEFLKFADYVIIDGLRSWEEYLYLKDKFKNIYLLALYTSPKIRHYRLKERQERSLSEVTAAKRDIAELLNLNMSPPIALADYLIKNEGSVANLHEELGKFLKVIKKMSKI